MHVCWRVDLCTPSVLVETDSYDAGDDDERYRKRIHHEPDQLVGDLVRERGREAWGVCVWGGWGGARKRG
jgi:hypothetical protein